MKEVILKCRFGDNLPDPRVPVKLSKDDANYLISQGLASEPTVESIQSDDVLTKQIAELTQQVADLESQLALFSASPKGGTNGKASTTK